jgi:hypothetical protein
MTRSTPWAILLCKFSDDAVEPMPRSFYEGLFTASGAGTMNMVQFFHDNSHGCVDLSGSQVFGWYTLPQRRSSTLEAGLTSKVDRSSLVGQSRLRQLQRTT